MMSHQNGGEYFISGGWVRLMILETVHAEVPSSSGARALEPVGALWWFYASLLIAACFGGLASAPRLEVGAGFLVGPSRLE